MPETVSSAPSTASAAASASAWPAVSTRRRTAIQLYLAEGCPRSLRISVTLGNRRPPRLGRHHVADASRRDTRRVRRAARRVRGHLAPLRRSADGARPVRPLERTDRQQPHAGHPARYLAGLPVCQGDARLPRLNPPALTADIDALRDLLDRDVTRPRRRSRARQHSSHWTGKLPPRTSTRWATKAMAADVDLWVALTQLGPTESRDGRLRDYVRRLDAHPAFHGKVR